MGIERESDLPPQATDLDRAPHFPPCHFTWVGVKDGYDKGTEGLPKGYALMAALELI